MRKIPLSLLTGAALACALAFPTHAQQNTLSILQEGIGNSLTVDQSGATNSHVRGLSIDSEATGLDLDEQIALTDSARQLGGNNSADVTITESNGIVYLYQNNTVGGTDPANANSATVVSRNGGVGIVGQTGFDNTANLTVDGSLSGATSLSVDGQEIDGAIIQSGSGNESGLITGPGTSAILVQNGSGSSSSLDISGSAPGASVVYTQIGNGLTPLAEAQVITNALGTVQITQTNIGGVATRGAVTVNQTTR